MASGMHRVGSLAADLHAGASGTAKNAAARLARLLKSGEAMKAATLEELQAIAKAIEEMRAKRVDPVAIRDAGKSLEALRRHITAKQKEKEASATKKPPLRPPSPPTAGPTVSTK